MRHARLQNRTHPLPRPLQVAYCDSFFCRLAGLMFRRSIAPFSGLLMVQPAEDRLNAAIHMLFMNFDLAVVWMDRNLQVVDVKHARHWRPAYTPARPALYVLEAHPDHIAHFHPGDQVELESCDD